MDKFDCILIDDDEMIRDSWKYMAKFNKKKIAIYSTPKDFSLDMEQYDCKTPIYIDSNLGNGIKGEEVAKEFYDKGFKEIYLATGLIGRQVEGMYWIKDVVSKMPEF